MTDSKEEKVSEKVKIILHTEIVDGMQVGKVSRHPDGYLVYISDGSFMRNGRVSNFWDWHRLNDDGTLGESEGGYGW